MLLRRRIGTADAATEWFTERTEPLLRALLLMLVVWLLFPLVAQLFEEPSTASLRARRRPSSTWSWVRVRRRRW